MHCGPPHTSRPWYIRVTWALLKVKQCCFSNASSFADPSVVTETSGAQSVMAAVLNKLAVSCGCIARHINNITRGNTTISCRYRALRDVNLYPLILSTRNLFMSFLVSLLVGAPREKAELKVPANRTGGVYSCPITWNQSDCNRVKLVDPGKTVRQLSHFGWTNTLSTHNLQRSPPPPADPIP